MHLLTHTLSIARGVSGARAAGVAALLCWPGVASAATVVLSPLLTDGSVQPKQLAGIHQLIASELDFQPGVEGVVDLPAAPANLNASCLANPRCLFDLASANGGTSMLAGSATAVGGAFVLDLVYVDGTQARKNQFTVPQDSSGLANAMTPIVKQMLTGEGPEPERGPPTSFAADPEPTSGFVAAPPPPPMGNSFPPPAPPPPAPLPPPVPVAAPGNDTDLAGMISFGQSATDISAEEVNQMIRFGSPTGAPAPAPAPAPWPAPAAQPTQPWPQPAPQPVARQGTIAEEEAELEGMDQRRNALADMESESVDLPRSAELGHKVQVSARGGFSKYYAFNFVTGGAEIGILAAGGLHVVAGVEVYAVKRVLPPDLQLQTGVYSEWNTIFPLNAGLLYKFPLDMAQPYVGADTILVQYYKDEIGADWAGGARLRGGVDLMVVNNFGFNVNIAAGAWFGQNWSIIQPEVGNAGFLPQVSAGTVVAF